MKIFTKDKARLILAIILTPISAGAIYFTNEFLGFIIILEDTYSAYGILMHLLFILLLVFTYCLVFFTRHAQTKLPLLFSY